MNSFRATNLLQFWLLGLNYAVSEQPFCDSEDINVSDCLTLY